MRRNCSYCLLCVLVAFAMTAASADPLVVFQMNIENITDATLGSTVDISIDYLSGSEVFAGYRFVVSFAAADLEFVEAMPGDAISGCGWESFVVQQLPCPGCDNQLYQISAVADIEDGDNHPSCLSAPGELARLRIKMPTDTNLAGETFTVDFYWVDCESNILTSAGLDSTYFGKFIFDYLGAERTGLDPNLGGPAPGCVAPDGVVPVRGINYYSGSITLSSELGLFGDVNGDGKVNITDATYLIRFFYYGGPPPQDYLFGDLNQDGVTNVADAVYLLSYIFGLGLL